MFTATDITTFGSFSIKCKPASIDELRATYQAVQEPSYFSKKHWCRVVVDGSISDKVLYEFLETSYSLTVANLPKRVQQELEEGSDV